MNLCVSVSLCVCLSVCVSVCLSRILCVNSLVFQDISRAVCNIHIFASKLMRYFFPELSGIYVDIWYMNLCVCVCLSVPKYVHFSIPPFLVRFSAPPLCVSLSPQEDWDTGPPGHWDTWTLGKWDIRTMGHRDTGTTGVGVPTFCNHVVIFSFSLNIHVG